MRLAHAQMLVSFHDAIILYTVPTRKDIDARFTAPSWLRILRPVAAKFRQSKSNGI